MLQEVLSKPDLRTGILSHLTLSEIQESFRSVSKNCRTEVDNYKAFMVEQLLSHKNLKVLVVGLESEKSKLLNGKIGHVDTHKRKKDGRFAIRLHVNWLSDDSEVKGLKLSNLHPFFRHQPDDSFSCPPLLADYTDTTNMRESHGRLLHQLLAFAKWFVIEVEGIEFPGDLNHFMSLPLSHPFHMETSARMFDYWTEPPFRCSRSRRRFGTALDYVVGMFMFNFEDVEEHSVSKARYDKLWPADGNQGKDMVRNFFHFLKSWKEERVTGGFWVTDIFKTGTVMVHLLDLNDPESFSTVYIVKGHNDPIGDLVEQSAGQLPGFCEATILPLYDFWTYDGTAMEGKYSLGDVGGPIFEEKLRLHVMKAISSHTVSWRGPSAEQGSWDFEKNEPPPIPRFRVNEGNYFVMDWQDSVEETAPSSIDVSLDDEQFTADETAAAKEIAAMAHELGGARNLGESEPRQRHAALTVRRLGDSYEENPNGICTLLDTRIEKEPIHAFHFAVADHCITTIPRYSLKDLLQAILAAMKEASPLPLVECILIDDRTLLRPLDTIMVHTFEEVGLLAPEVDYLGVGL
jgi:hypothetical protein